MKAYLSGLLAVVCAYAQAAQLEVGTLSLPAVAPPSTSFVSVGFQQVYSAPPLVFVLMDMSNPEPAMVRIRNVTVAGFEAGKSMGPAMPWVLS